MNKISTPPGIFYRSSLHTGIFLVMLAFSSLQVNAQLTYNETFDITAPSNTIPLGWSQGKVGVGSDPDNYWDRIGPLTTNPTASPRGGSTAMMRYRSFFTVANEAAYLSSKVLDYSAWVAGSPVVSFYMYRDDQFLLVDDRIQVYINTSPDLSGTPIGPVNENVSGFNAINRPCTSNPAVVGGNCAASGVYTATAWQQYAYNIDVASIPVGSRNSVYVIIVATSQDGNNIYIDDFSVQSYPSAQAYTSNCPTPGTSAQFYYQNTATTQAGAADQLIMGCKIKMNGAATGTLDQLISMTFNVNGTTNGANITSAKLWYSGGTNAYVANSILLGTTGGPLTCTNFKFSIGAAGGCPANLNAQFPGATPISLEHGDNYFWVTYTIAAGPIPGGNCVDAEWVDFTLNVNGVGGLPGSPISPCSFSLAGCREIDLVYCIPSMSVGTSWPNGGYYENDYVAGVRLDGDNGAWNGISTGWKNVFPAVPGTITAAPGVFNTDGPNWGDCDGTPYANAQCPFQKHPASYELWPVNTQRTTALTPDGGATASTQYSLTAWVGRWFSSNYLAAWIDLNKNATLNDQPLISTNVLGVGTVVPTGNSISANQITLTTPGITGMAVNNGVWGPGIAANTRITGIAGSTITLSIPLPGGAASIVNQPIYIGFVDAFGNFGEKIGESAGLVNGASKTFQFAIPNWGNISTGNMRLRVREVFANTGITSCGGYTFGECEDYTITMVPPCNTLGYGAPAGLVGAEVYDKVWLGFTDDWSTASNWCPPGPPSNVDDAFIPKYCPLCPAPVAPRTSYRPGQYSPVIKTGTVATTRKLRIEATDSVKAFAWASSSLTLNDSLIIEGVSAPLTKLQVISLYSDSARLSGGTITTPTAMNPWRPTNVNFKVKAMWVYRQSELLAQGLIAGDVVDSIDCYVQRQTIGSAPYNNLKVKIYTVSPIFAGLGGFTGSFMPYSAPSSLVSGPVTVYTGSAVSVDFVTGFNLAPPNMGVIRIPTTGFVWDGSPNDLVVEISYDNNGTPSTGQDFPKVTQTLGYTLYAVIYGNPAVAAEAMDHLTPGITFTRASTFYRPNLTFKFRRPFGKYYIYAKKHWVNHGEFQAGNSRVVMDGTTNQWITGVSNTTFHELQISNGNHVRRKTDFTVQDTLDLTAGRLQLDSGTVHLLNPETGGLRLNGGRLNSETAPAAGLYYGNFHWNMTGSVATPIRTIPFQNNAGADVFVTYTMTGGTHDVTFATYATPPSNAPLPQHLAGVPGPVVTNINGYATGTNNSANMIDRYWKVYNATPIGASSNLALRWSAVEQSSGVGTYLGQRWVQDAGSTTPGSGWEYPFLGPQSPAADSVRISGFNLFDENIWWAVVRDNAPLPVELLEFTAKPMNGMVRLNWSTASELNNDKFVIDRTVNMNDWTFIDQVKSRGNSVVTQYYETWDENPVNGMQYYMLRQYDIGGLLTNYGPIAVDMTTKQFGIVSAAVQTSSQGITLIFNYDSSEPYTVEVIDMLGQVVGASSNNPASPGLNVMDIKANLSSGIYQIVLRNSTQVDTRKIMY